MTRRRLFFALVLAAAACCARPAGSTAKTVPNSDPAAVSRLASAANGFGFELFRQLLAKDPDRNIFISPTSVATALGMTWNGARSETRQVMADVLEISMFSPDDANSANAALLAALRSADPKVQLEIANSLWARKGISFSPEFVKMNQKYYGAEMKVLDFASPAAVKTINGWVAQKTRDKIKSIISELLPDEVLVLINAVYFKGKWTKQFDKKLTREQEFYRADGTVKRHPLMHQGGEYQYYSGDGLQLVRLPYGNERISMLVFLPDIWEPEEPAPMRPGGRQLTGLGLAVVNLAGRLTPENWQRWTNSMSERKGDIAIPRFKLEYEESLNQVLKNMGMESAFDPARADFTGMMSSVTDVQFAISEVRHKSFVEVNEEGTEAAAVTAVKMIATAMPVETERFSMIVDRPFLYAIQDDLTGAILFLGAVFDPK